MKKKLFSIVSVLLVVSMLFTACAKPATDKKEKEDSTSTQKTEEKEAKSVETDKTDKIVRLISGGEPGSLHPALAQGTHESIILDHVFMKIMIY